MTAPIDIECPACKATAGDYCTSTLTTPLGRLLFHHAERVDAAAWKGDDLTARRAFAELDNLRAALATCEQERDSLRADLDGVADALVGYGVTALPPARLAHCAAVAVSSHRYALAEIERLKAVAYRLVDAADHCRMCRDCGDGPCCGSCDVDAAIAALRSGAWKEETP